MGLQRPPEAFQRLYSAPEPPAPARRPRVLVLVVAVAAVVLAAGGVYFLLPGGEPVAGDREASVGGAAPGRPSIVDPPRDEAIAELPRPCGTVSAGTVRSLVPGAQRLENSNQTLTTCTYTSGGDQFRWLRVEAHLYSPANTPTPVQDASRYYGAQWTQAQDAPLERTVSLSRHPGLGDEAYRWFKEDRGQPTVVGQVTVRLRNTVITVGYSEQTGGSGGVEAREDVCLENATRVAREVLLAFR